MINLLSMTYQIKRVVLLNHKQLPILLFNGTCHASVYMSFVGIRNLCQQQTNGLKIDLKSERLILLCQTALNVLKFCLSQLLIDDVYVMPIMI